MLTPSYTTTERYKNKPDSSNSQIRGKADLQETKYRHRSGNNGIPTISCPVGPTSRLGNRASEDGKDHKNPQALGAL
ncbi:hypothetical protein IL306_010626 [Fusarium sp. DS 682]|nr:hypothetical protein IL306_010626 [Fusarium sp. DS 682]